MTTLFISDLHLDAARPETTTLLSRFLLDEAVRAEAVYILGDLFEAWVGDDDDSEPGATVATELRALRDNGVPVYFMRGNRDFLIGPDYAARAGLGLLPDPCVLNLYGEPTLLMHGDLLCTDDVAYQAFRRQVRDPNWQQDFLAQPLPARREFAAKARLASQAHQRGAMETIVDVSPPTVEAIMSRYGVRRMIHGHTHRPAVHSLNVDEQTAQRIVLGDWYTQGSMLRVSPDGCELLALA